MKRLNHAIDWIILGLCICGYCIELSNPSLTWEIFLGILAALYCTYSIVVLLALPIKFDWILAKGRFLIKVLNFVLLVPFILTLGIYLNANNSESNEAYSSQNLVYDENLYAGDTSIKEPDEAPSLFWSVYFHYIDPGNQHMAYSDSGRRHVALIAILGFLLLNGLLVSTLISWFDRRKDKWLKGEVRYNNFLRFKSHYVIIGGNDMVAGIVKQKFEEIEEHNGLFKPYILILTSRDVEKFRSELFSELDEHQQQRVIIYNGNRLSEEDIKSLCLGRTIELFMLGEDVRNDDMESYHDTINMKCLSLISSTFDTTLRAKYMDYLKRKDKSASKRNSLRLVCRVLFEYQTSFNIIQVTDIDKSKITFLPFNYYEMWAQHVLVCRELNDKAECKYLPLEGFDGIKHQDDTFVHLVVVGMSRMGLAMAIEAAHVAHYPNFVDKKIRTRITFIDASMEQEKNFFMGRFKELFSLSRYRDVDTLTEDIYSNTEAYPWKDMLLEDAKNDYLGDDVLDIEWEFIEGSVENPHIQKYLEDAAANSNAKLTIAVCLPENNRALAAAAYMPDSLYASESTLQVLVYQRLCDDLLEQICQNNIRYHGKLKAFGMAKECYDLSLVKISEYVGGEIGVRYDQYQEQRTKSIMEIYAKEGLTEADYRALSPSYKLIEEREDMCELRDKVREMWREWFDANKCNYGGWSGAKNKMTTAIDTMIHKELGIPEPVVESTVGKSMTAKMWSNTYNIHSMWTKFRCFGVDPMHQEFDDSTIDMLGKMEHNRWNMEQLLLRFRPLTREEQQRAMVVSYYASTLEKEALKKCYAHLDICSNEILDRVDYRISELDVYLLKTLPIVYRKYSKKSK